MTFIENGSNAEDIGYKAVVPAWTLLSISIITCIARIFAKCFVEGDHVAKRGKWRKLGWDDYLMFAALIIEIAHSSCLTAAWHLGMGRHISLLSGHMIERTVHMLTVVKGLSCIPYTLGRMSVALYQLKLLQHTDRNWKWGILIAVLVVQPIINGIVVIQIYTQCGSHIEALWTASEQAKYCLPATVETNLGYVQSSLNSLSDLTLSLFPLVILWNLQIARSKKVQLYAVLSTSYLALIASIVKTVEIGALSANSDFTWNFVFLQIWVVVEVNVIIITGNFPAMLPLLKLSYHHVKTLHSLHSRTSPSLPQHSSLNEMRSKNDSQELAILKVSEYNVQVDEKQAQHSVSAASGSSDV